MKLIEIFVKIQYTDFYYQVIIIIIIYFKAEDIVPHWSQFEKVSSIQSLVDSTLKCVSLDVFARHQKGFCIL